MAKIAKMFHAILWVAMGCWCIAPAFEEKPDSWVLYAFLVFGASSIFNAVACVLRWRIWWASSRILGVVLVLYAWDVLLLGHGEDFGGFMPWLGVVAVSLGFGVWSVVLPWLTGGVRTLAQPGAAPNVGPAAPVSNSGVVEGPASVN
jgi:hypothetical protein